MTMSFILIRNDENLNRLWTGLVTQVKDGNPLAIKAERWILNEADQERFQFIKNTSLILKIPHCISSMWQEKDLVEISHQADIDQIWVKNTRTKATYLAGPDLQIATNSAI